jgi:hypothetical protein
MEFLKIGRYSLNIAKLEGMTKSEALETFHGIPKNVIEHAYQLVKPRSKKKPKEKSE